MRYKDLTEYNKGDIVRTPDSIILPRLKKSVGPLEMFSATGIYYIFYLNEGNSCWYFLSNKEKAENYGFIRLEHVVDDIWQVKESWVKVQNKGLGSSLYYFIVRIGSPSFSVTPKKLINDYSLSDIAEKIWTTTLVSKSLKRKVYDKKLNLLYDESAIGTLTKDGVQILNPKEDTTDWVDDMFAEGMRFFWLVESEHLINVHPLRSRCLTEEFTEELFQATLKEKNSSSFGFAYKWAHDGDY